MTPKTADRAVILASGGLDSTVAAAVARRDGFRLHFLTFAYRQRHAVEITRAAQVANAFHADHLVLNVDLRAIGGSALSGDLSVPKGRAEIERNQGIPSTYVPCRNLIFLSLAAAHAEVLGATAIYFGANIVDYSGYPDCQPAFIQAVEAAITAGTKAGVEGKHLQIRTPLLKLTKSEIIRLGLTLEVPFHLTHSCYDPVETVACGQCDSCLIRKRGFAEAGVVDPVPYAVS